METSERNIEANMNELIGRIEAKYEKMSKGQKRLAEYVKENYDKAVFLTAARLGEIVGVSESTVVRFATQLGYRGYPEFQKALEELVRNKLNSIQRMEVTYGRITQSEILETVLQSDIEKIKMTLSAIELYSTPTVVFNASISLGNRKIQFVIVSVLLNIVHTNFAKDNPFLPDASIFYLPRLFNLLILESSFIPSCINF